MTTTMTAEDRAKALSDSLGNADWWGESETISLIATAIRQAEDAKLEEAAGCAQAILEIADPGGCSWCAADEIQRLIRNLKSSPKDQG